MKLRWSLFMLLVLVGFARSQDTVTVDPQTGRAKGAKEMSAEELRDRIKEILVIDVRDPEEFQKETIKGAINIPLPQLEAKLKGILRDKILVFT